jgi:hypothetical protein
MDKQVKLKVKIVEERGDQTLVESRLIEGTPFQIVVPSRMVDKEGSWIWVTSHGTVGDKVSLTLPAPITNMGSRVTVDKSELVTPIIPNAVSGISTAPRKR